MKKCEIKIANLTLYKTCKDWFYYDGQSSSFPEWLIDRIVPRNSGMKGLDYDEAFVGTDNHKRKWIMIRGANGFAQVYPNSIVFRIEANTKYCRNHYEVWQLDGTD